MILGAQARSVLAAHHRIVRNVESMKNIALQKLKSEADKCVKCDLYKTCSNLVFGVGNENADLLFVGEAPGFHEDQKGEPFVGAAGKLLDQLLETIGLQRKDVYITNVLKCRPPNNRNPLPDEISECKDMLFRQIEIIDPKIISTLGNFSTKLILGTDLGISKLHGKPVEKEGRIVFPIYHPAAGLYTPSTKKILEEDFQMMGSLLTDISNDIKKTTANDIDCKTKAHAKVSTADYSIEAEHHLSAENEPEQLPLW